ncbi:PAS domain S-box protein [Hymenobacter sp. BRD67]|uniref:sensor histidine kinase n=1 Tax=Hymenobacter sp. BRD67 TaxID=2675877 RepID=UPI001567C607|nr:PAS domain S-box protein [Hymenobacter sp. BRD67]QKG54127.1 PAS domain S-box protein [Hymenobacter sp. BRD67]
MRAERRRLVAESLPANINPEVQRLVQELQVHQIELEMQYEELLLAQTEAESNRLKYLDLYDFAPVGYCTLTANGTLQQLNLHLSQLLGQVRQQLLNRRLALFVVPAERPAFADFIARLWAGPDQRQSCELTMQRDDRTTFFAQLEGVLAPEGAGPGRPATGCRLVVLDITERRRVAAALAASEARFRAAFEQSRDAALLLEGYSFADANSIALRMLGVASTEQLKGRRLPEFWPERQPDGRRSLQLLTDCMSHARSNGWCRLEWMRYNAAGEPVWDELSFTPVLVQGQALLSVVWRDITARQHSEQQLRESEARLQMALAAANTGVWSWELATGQLQQDARAQQIFGLNTAPTAHTLPFACLQDAIYPADQAVVQQALDQAMLTHAVFDLEHRLVRADGTVSYVAAMGRFSYDERTGQPRHLTGLVRDVTSRRVAQEELSYKNRLLGNILHHLPVVLSRLGLDGCYREQTGYALRRLGLANNELVGQKEADLFPTTAAHFERLRTGQSDSYVLTIEYQGRSAVLQCFGFFDEEKQEVVIFALDVTESERLKEEATQLKLRQQQEVLSAILTTQEQERRRIAEALHNGVGQLLYATRLHLDTLPPSEAVRAGRQLLNEAIQATRNISFELTPTILEDFGLAAALQELVGRIPGSLAVDLNLKGLAQTLPSMLATAIYRIVQELLNNAMKHAQAQEVFVEVSQENEQVYIVVEDDGVGFEASSPASLAGIGLAGIRTRVGLLGGSITIKSRPGQGTGFFLQLPVPAA